MGGVRNDSAEATHLPFGIREIWEAPVFNSSLVLFFLLDKLESPLDLKSTLIVNKVGEIGGKILHILPKRRQAFYYYY